MHYKVAMLISNFIDWKLRLKDGIAGDWNPGEPNSRAYLFFVCHPIPYHSSIIQT